MNSTTRFESIIQFYHLTWITTPINCLHNNIHHANSASYIFHHYWVLLPTTISQSPCPSPSLQIHILGSAIQTMPNINTVFIKHTTGARDFPIHLVPSKTLFCASTKTLFYNYPGSPHHQRQYRTQSWATNSEVSMWRMQAICKIWELYCM